MNTKTLTWSLKAEEYNNKKKINIPPLMAIK
jgi:hypothetical protein